MFSSFQPLNKSNNKLMGNLANEIAGVRKEIKHVGQDLRKEIEFVRKEIKENSKIRFEYLKNELKFSNLITCYCLVSSSLIEAFVCNENLNEV